MVLERESAQLIRFRFLRLKIGGRAIGRQRHSS